MKKSIVTLVAVGALLTSAIGVNAAELTYTGYEDVPEASQSVLDERIAVVEDAVDNGALTDEQGSTLVQHIIDSLLDPEHVFGENGRRGQAEDFEPGTGNDNEDCVLGLEDGLGLFAGENGFGGAGNGEAGSGNGLRGNQEVKGSRFGGSSEDGVADSTGFRGANRGAGLANDGVCLIEE